MGLQVKQLTPLCEEFIPNQIIARTEQLNEIFKLTIIPYTNSNLWIEGDQGLGKTLIVRDFFAKEVENRTLGKIFYIYCEASFRSALADMCRAMNLHIPYRQIGAGSIAYEVLKTYPECPRYIFVIDEPEKIYKSAVKDIADFVHALYNHLLVAQKPFNILFISRENKNKASRTFSADTLSRLKLQGVIFPCYTSPQITEILKQRLDISLEPDQYQDHAIIALSNHIYKIGGDIRQALEIIRHAVDTSENCITLQKMEEAIEWGKIKWWRSQIIDRMPSPHWSLITRIAAVVAQNSIDDGVYIANQPDVLKMYTKTVRTLALPALSPSSVYYVIKKIGERYGYYKQDLEGRGASMHLIFEDKNDRNHIIRATDDVDWEEQLSFDRKRETWPVASCME